MNYPKSIWFILGNEFCERFGFCGVRIILVVFLTEIQKYDYDTATIVFHMFLVSAYLTPFFGAIVADSYWGKYKTINVMSFVHVIGNIVVTVASFTTSVNIHFQRVFTLVGLFLTAVGAGGVKPCISSFGGDQFALPGQENRLQMFFSMFYFAVNAGSLFTSFVAPELRKSVRCFGKDSCYPLAFGVSALLMLMSMVIFVSGKRYYKIKKPVSSAVASSIGCMFHALKNKMTASPGDAKRNDWLEYADDEYEKQEILDLRSALDVMFLFVPLPLFYTLFDQQGSRWTFQGMLMNGKIDFLNWTIKPDQVHLINPLCVLICIPLFDAVVYPILRTTGVNTPLRKISVGGIITALSFVSAAVVQYVIMGKNSTLLPHESGLRIYNSFNCQVTVCRSASVGNNFSVKPLHVSDHNYSPVQLGETDVLTVHADPACRYETINSLKEPVSIHEGKTSSYVLKYNYGHKVLELRPLREMKKLRNGNPNFRILHDDDLFGENVTLTDVSNVKKISEIRIQLQSMDPDRNYEIHVGTYNICLEDHECVLRDVDFLPASINYLLLNRTNAKLITSETGKYIHILWQVPQLLLITIGEVMYVVTLLEFSYTQAPSSMKSFLTATNLCTKAVGNLIIVILSKMRLFDNQGHEFLFYAILMILAMVVFMIMSTKYKYKCTMENQPSR